MIRVPCFSYITSKNKGTPLNSEMFVHMCTVRAAHLDVKGVLKSGHGRLYPRSERRRGRPVGFPRCHHNGVRAFCHLLRPAPRMHARYKHGIRLFGVGGVCCDLVIAPDRQNNCDTSFEGGTKATSSAARKSTKCGFPVNLCLLLSVVVHPVRSRRANAKGNGGVW